MSWLLYIFMAGKLVGIVELPVFIDTYSQCKLFVNEAIILKPNQSVKCVKGALHEI